ncbi:hypothetical protein KGQ31_01935 [Patescibacteria group bacterium]|nr:hypothetical protein [Patescibacteria group bacterium]
MKSITTDLLLGKFSHLSGSIVEFERVCLTTMALPPESYDVLAERMINDRVFAADFLADFILAVDEGEKAEVKLIKDRLERLSRVSFGAQNTSISKFLGKLSVLIGRRVRRSPPC